MCMFVGLLEIINYRAKMGMCITDPELRFLMRKVAVELGGNEVPMDFPNQKFVQRFVKKYSTVLSYRRAQILDIKRAESSTGEVVSMYFDQLSEIIAPFLSRPETIWNCDETGICPQGHTKVRVVCPKKMRANVRRSQERENISIMGCINAKGEFMPPMYIFAGKYCIIVFIYY